MEMNVIEASHQRSGWTDHHQAIGKVENNERCALAI
jgi:hypothetical protein